MVRNKQKKKSPFSGLSLPALLIFFLSGALPALAGEAFLSWDPNTEPDLAGYRVYIGTASGRYGEPIWAGNQTTYTIEELPTGTFYFAVTAVDTAGNESGYSNEARKTIDEESAALILRAQADTFINLDHRPNAAAPTLNTYTWPDFQPANAILMKFDLSPLPPGAVILEALLYLALVDSDKTADPLYTVTLHKIINNNPDPSYATGYSFDGFRPWTPALCCYKNIPLAQKDLSPPYDTQGIDRLAGYKSWTATALTQEWAASPSTNFGLLLNSDPAKRADRYRYFAGTEYPDAALRPYLSIRYLLPFQKALLTEEAGSSQGETAEQLPEIPPSASAGGGGCSILLPAGEKPPGPFEAAEWIAIVGAVLSALIRKGMRSLK